MTFKSLGFIDPDESASEPSGRRLMFDQTITSLIEKLEGAV